MLQLLILLFFEILFAQIPPTLHDVYPTHIAHAGGAIGHLTYTNSLEAFDASYKKQFTFFEADLALTADNTVVLLHDWDYSIEHFYHAPKKIYTLAEFKQLKLHHGLTHMTWSELIAWLETRPDVTIITDTKQNTLDILKKISTDSADLRSRIIPQIYQFSEFDAVQKLGFEKIILTLYASDYSDKEIVGFAENHTVWAVTMPISRVQDGTLPRKLRDMGIPSYVHTVNSSTQASTLRQAGIYGFYTDFLQP